MLQLYIRISSIIKRETTSLSTYRRAVYPYSFVSMSMVTHTDTLGSVPTQWRPLSLINTIVMSPVYCCMPHSRVSDLWPRQPSGLSVFTYALCLILLFSLCLKATQIDWSFKAWKTLDKTINCPDNVWQAMFTLTRGDIWVWMDGLAKKASAVYTSVGLNLKVKIMKPEKLLSVT